MCHDPDFPSSSPSVSVCELSLYSFKSSNKGSSRDGCSGSGGDGLSARMKLDNSNYIISKWNWWLKLNAYQPTLYRLVQILSGRVSWHVLQIHGVFWGEHRVSVGIHKSYINNLPTSINTFPPPMSILPLVAPLVASHNTITIGEKIKEHTKRWLTGGESRKDHNRSMSTSTALPQTVRTSCNMQSEQNTDRKGDGPPRPRQIRGRTKQRGRAMQG
jgi:hypothetical protein